MNTDLIFFNSRSANIIYVRVDTNNYVACKIHWMTLKLMFCNLQCCKKKFFSLHLQFKGMPLWWKKKMLAKFKNTISFNFHWVWSKSFIFYLRYKWCWLKVILYGKCIVYWPPPLHYHTHTHSPPLGKKNSRSE